MNQRLKALVFVAALFAVGYGIMFFLNRRTNNGTNEAYSPAVGSSNARSRNPMPHGSKRSPFYPPMAQF